MSVQSGFFKLTPGSQYNFSGNNRPTQLTAALNSTDFPNSPPEYTPTVYVLDCEILVEGDNLQNKNYSTRFGLEAYLPPLNAEQEGHKAALELSPGSALAFWRWFTDESGFAGAEGFVQHANEAAMIQHIKDRDIILT